MLAPLLAAVLSLTRFPGDAPVASASQRFVVGNQELAQPTRAGFRHALYVQDRSSGARHRLLEYPREVTVAWAPKGEAIAVTNRLGSTQTTAAVFVLDGGSAFRKVDVADAIYAAFPSLRGELGQFLHVHLEVVGWRGDAVECRLRAYAGAGPDVTHRYAVTTDGRARRL